MATVLEALAEERPLVVVFEDLQWADGDLLDFLDHLVDWTSDVPLLVVCTARPELLERRPAWGGGKPNALTLSLSPLSDEETASLIASLSERPVLLADTRADLLARAGGNPLYAEQYARMLAEQGGAAAVPETLQGIVAARLDLLEPEAKAMLQSAAVLGRTFWSGGVAALRRSDVRLVEEELHALQRKDFVRRERRSTIVGDTEYTFLHVLVRDVAYGQIPRAERGGQHRLAGLWIESLGPSTDHADLLAHHYVAALEIAEATGADASGLAPPASRALLVAADRALALNAFAQARDLFRRALELLPAGSADRPAILLRLSRALHRLSEGADDVAQAVEALVEAGDVEGAAEAELLLADMAWQSGARNRSRSHLDRATSLIAGNPPSPTKARILSETSRYRMLASESEDAIELAREAIELAERLGLDLVLAHALNNLGVSQARLGDPGGFAALERAIEIADRLNSPEVARGYNNLGATRMELGDVRGGIDAWRRGAAATARFGEFDITLWLRHQVAFPVAFLEGRWDDVLAAVEGELGRRAHYLHRNAYEHRGRIRLARGDVAGAVEDARASLEFGRRAADPQSLAPAISFAAFACLAAGSTAEADAYVNELLGLDAIRSPVPHHSWWFDPSWVLTDLGRVDDLAGALSRVERRTRWVEAAEAIARGRYVQAADLYRPNHPAEAYTRLRAARAGLPDARLDRAIAFFRRAGATAYLAEAEALEIPA